MTKLAVGSILAAVLALAAVGAARGQGPDVQIVRLECIDDPDVGGTDELVIIENRGDAPQTLAGWQLQSDPAGSEVFDLSVRASLLPGQPISVRSGPGASGVFIWSSEFIFRDDDPTDYARIVDDTGAIVHQVNCAAEPSPAAAVPNGGGPPPPSSNALSPAMMVLIGGFMAAAGLATIARPWLRLRHSRPGGS